MGNMKVFEVSLFMPVAVWLFFFTPVSIASLCTKLTHKDLQLFSEVAVYTHVNIVRLACSYYSKLKSGLIHRGVSRADQKDLGEDRTKNVKSCSLSNKDTSISVRAP